ncbi:hypothetical protein GOBAR_AA08467 [Gossypium barbadense]|uniref:Trichome birefringence-like C-terminal domain-containing protein n=1 Tax=Gossypium barbadense TaxID=3634 RepID=A0A2P5Y9B1_GOSBA|nr:hypothetical protein GOBAR_AA08467 [Gossypium barbadense]
MVVIFRMRNKTIAFVGDSLGRQQFQSMMCMVSGGEHIIYVEDAAREYGLVKPRGAKRPDGWVYRFTKTNTTILYYWSASLSDLVPINSTDKASDVAMHLDRPPAFLRRYLHRFDVLVLNTGHHWNRGKFEGNRWVMHVNGKPNENKEFEDIRNAKNFTVHSFVRWLDSQLTSHPRLKAFFRTISPRHYRNGDWNTGGTCNNTIPLTNGSEVLQDGSNDKVVESAVRGTKVKLLDITAISELRDEAHMSGHHWNRGKFEGNRWVMHVNGKPNENKEFEDIRNAKNFTVHSFVRWLDSQLTSHPRLKAFFRTISPRHYRNGDWNTGGTCNNTIPLTNGSEVLQDGSNDKVVESAVRGTKVKLLDITAISELRDEAHMSGYSIRPTQSVNDCLHWCLPGVPDSWNEILIAQI